MKKITTLLLAFVLMLCMVACGGGEKTFEITRSTVDETTRSYYNTMTGLKFYVPEDFIYTTDEYIARDMFGKTAREMNAMTQEELKKLDFVPDFIVQSDDCQIEMRYLNLNILLMGEEERTEDVYLDKVEREFREKGIAETLERENVTLGGLDFTRLTGKKSSGETASVLVHKLNEDYMVCLIVEAKTDVNNYYLAALFDEGIRKTDPANVPVRSDFEEETFVFSNAETGVQFAVPSDWYYALDELVAQTYYGVSAETLQKLTAEDWAELSKIIDYVSYDSKNTVAVYYQNITKDMSAYGLNAEEYINRYIRTSTENGWYCDTENRTVNISGTDYIINSLWQFDENDNLNTVHLAAKKLNDDYLCIIEMTTSENYTAEDFLRFFATEEKPVNRVYPGEYNADSNSFYSEMADVTIDIPEGWEMCGYDYIAETYYNSRFTGEGYRTFSPEVLGEMEYVYDFEAYNPENGDRMLVAYQNMNYFSAGLETTDFYGYMDEIIAQWEEIETVTINETFNIEMDGRNYFCFDIDDVDGGVAYNTYLIFYQLDENYAMMLRADCIEDKIIDDFLFLMTPGKA